MRMKIRIFYFCVAKKIKNIILILRGTKNVTNQLSHDLVLILIEIDRLCYH
jgi:hypothetical protein